MRIGILDSGIGGLSLARKLCDQLPGHDILYWGDTARMPYGSRNPEAIRQYAVEGGALLVAAKVDLVVVACHTIAALAISDLNRMLNIPLFSIVDAAVEVALAASRKKRIGVVATRATADSRAYEEKIDRLCSTAKVYTVAAPLLVSLVEEGWLKRPETHRMVKHYVQPLKMRQIDTLILGCSHLSFLSNVIARKAGAQIAVVDAMVPLANDVRRFVDSNNAMSVLDKMGKLHVFVSEKTVHIEKAARLFFNGNVVLESGPITA